MLQNIHRLNLIVLLWRINYAPKGAYARSLAAIASCCAARFQERAYFYLPPRLVRDSTPDHYEFLMMQPSNQHSDTQNGLMKRFTNGLSLDYGVKQTKVAIFIIDCRFLWWAVSRDGECHYRVYESWLRV